MIVFLCYAVTHFKKKNISFAPERTKIKINQLKEFGLLEENWKSVCFSASGRNISQNKI